MPKKAKQIHKMPVPTVSSLNARVDPQQLLVGTNTTKPIYIEHLIDLFLEKKRARNTKRAYASDINALLDYLNVITIEDLAAMSFPDVVGNIYLFLEETKNIDEHTGELKNPKTVNRKAYAISGFFQFLMNVYGYPKNPLYDYDPYPVTRRSTTESLSRPQIKDLMIAAKLESIKSQSKARNYLAICFMLTMSLRRATVVNLKKSDIKHDDITIKTVSKGNIVDHKPIPAPLYKLLLDYIDTDPIKSDFLFHPVQNYSTGNLDKPISTDYLYSMVKALVKKVHPDKNITPHSFRKMFIEQALDNHEEYIAIINSTDHSTIEMLKYYDGREKLKHSANHGMGKLIE